MVHLVAGNSACLCVSAIEGSSLGQISVPANGHQSDLTDRTDRTYSTLACNIWRLFALKGMNRTCAYTMKLGSPSMLVLALVLSSCVTHAVTITWTNSLGGSWGAAANWSPNLIPGPSDTAIITNTGSYSVTLDTTRTVGGFVLGATSGSSTQALSLNNQVLALNGPATVNSRGSFIIDSGIFSGGSTSSLSGPITWAA